MTGEQETAHTGVSFEGNHEAFHQGIKEAVRVLGGFHPGEKHFLELQLAEFRGVIRI